MINTFNLTEIDGLTTATATDIKKLGWRGVVKKLGREGKGRLVITNNREVQAVILSPEEYGSLLDALRGVSVKREADLQELRRSFDARLAALNEPSASDCLRRVLREPMELGDVRAGESY